MNAYSANHIVILMYLIHKIWPGRAKEVVYIGTILLIRL